MTKFEKFPPLAEQDEQTAINLARDEFTAVHPTQPNPMLANEDIDAMAMQPVPLGSIDASDDTSDAIEVRPFPLDPPQVDEDADVAAVQPLPLEPVSAIEEDAEVTTTSAFTAMSVASSSYDAKVVGTDSYTDDDWQELHDKGLTNLTKNSWDMLGDLGLRDNLAKDASTGPLIAGTGWSDEQKDAADFLAQGSGGTLASRSALISDPSMLGIPKTHRMEVTSKGVLVTDSDVTEIDLFDTITYGQFTPKSNVRTTEYKVHSGVDASAAEGYVTFYGIDKNKWYSDYQNGNESSDGLPTGPYTHLTYNYQNIFKGGDNGNLVYGGSYADTLIGGQGDDIIYGVDGANLIYGVGGNNHIEAGDGNATVYGGTGDDFIVTGDGNSSVVLADGDNWVVVNQSAPQGDKEGFENTIVLGSGSDTVVLGDIAVSNTATTTTFSIAFDDLATELAVDITVDWMTVTADILSASNPLFGVVFSAGKSIFNALLDGSTTTQETTETPTLLTTEIYNFNPLEDRLLIPMASGGSTNIEIDTTNTNHDMVIKDYATGNVIAYVDFASKEEIFGTSGDLTLAEKQGFASSLLSNLMIMENETLTYGNNGDFTFTSDDQSAIDTVDLGAGRYMLAGAWGPNYMFGGSSSEYLYGTSYNDVLFAFDIDGDSVNSNANAGKTFYGFDGNNLYATGNGENYIFGGSGTDTVTYEYTNVAVHIDMTDLLTDPNNSEKGKFFLAEKQKDGTHQDQLWSVENIIGSNYDDVIVGDENDNSFYSTGGDNTWTGIGGDNTFVLTGGSSTITDFTFGSDTILIHKEAYVAGNVNFRANMEWVEGDDDWTLYNMAGDDAEALVILEKGDGFDGPVDFDLIRPNGTIDTITFDTNDNFGIDLIA